MFGIFEVVSILLYQNVLFSPSKVLSKIKSWGSKTDFVAGCFRHNESLLA
jgi:hypothetical protein